MADERDGEMMSSQTAETRLPLSAGWLGWLGAVPFVGLAGTVPFLSGAPRVIVEHALVAYGAAILSFLGGVHWGLAVRSRSSRDDGKLWLTLSVIPALAGWAALLVPETPGLFTLAIAAAVMLWVDIWATRVGQAPLWYPKLRIPLTCVVVAALLFAAII